MSGIFRGQGISRSTVGVSGNIIDASFQALVDAITYRLLKVGVAAQLGKATPIR
jgi:2-isopropylmalate synthase